MHPIEIDATLKLAKRTLRQGKAAEAEAMYRKVLAEQPGGCAEATHFLGLAAMRRGKPEEALRLVRESIAAEPSNPEFHNNLATVLGRMNKPIEALGAAQRALDLKGDMPEAWGNKGVALEALGRLDEAIEAYRKAAELKADHADALANLGNALSRKGQHEEAIGFLRKFAELRPRDAQARKALGNALRRASRATEAVTAYRMAVELNPKDADAYNNLGAALQESGRVAEAEEALRQCLSINPNHTDAHWNRGLALLSLGRWREGWMEYEWRRHLREDVGQRRDLPQPVWQGSPLEGRTVLLLCEQGLGDTIQFVRYAPLIAARGANVVIECQARLKPLLRYLETDGEDAGTRGTKVDAETRGHGDAGNGADRAFAASPCPRVPASYSPGVSASIRVVARGEPLPSFDYHARLMTLPGIFGSTPHDLPNAVPYLGVDAKRIERVGRVLERAFEKDAETRGRGDAEKDVASIPASPCPPIPASSSPLRVGLVWQGNTAHKGDRFRSIPLAKFAPLAQVPGVRLVSLQRGFGSEQADACRETVPLVQWCDPADLTADALLDTAAAMRHLDLVIAVDTAVAHLAGALGIPVWVAMPLACDWRWLLDREDTPWYPTMRLFRQRDLGDWDEVIARLAAALRDRAATGIDAATDGRPASRPPAELLSA